MWSDVKLLNTRHLEIWWRHDLFLSIGIMNVGALLLDIQILFLNIRILF